MALSILPSGEPETWTLAKLFQIDPNTHKASGLLVNVMDLALLLAGGIAVIYLIVGAFYYFTAYGNEEQANKGKNTITWAIVGIIVILLAEVIVNMVWNFITPTPMK